MRPDSLRPRRFFPGLDVSWFAVAAVLLLVTHVALLIVFGHSPSVGAWSDFLQLVSAVFAAFVCFVTGRRSEGIARPFWYLTGATFATWSLGKCFLVYDFYFRGLATVSVVPLLLFFLAAAPLFVAVFIADDDFKGMMNWEWILDATQMLALTVVIYLFVVYIPLLIHGEEAVSSIEDRLLLWRNILLTGGLLTRAIFSRSSYIKRLYLPVSIVVGVFAASTWIANRVQEVSDAPETAWYDLAWSIPFCLIALTAAFWREPKERKNAPSHVPGISHVVIAYLPSLILPVILLVKYREVVREQIFLGLFGLSVANY